MEETGGKCSVAGRRLCACELREGGDSMALHCLRHSLGARLGVRGDVPRGGWRGYDVAVIPGEHMRKHPWLRGAGNCPALSETLRLVDTQLCVASCVAVARMLGVLANGEPGDR